MSPVMCDEIGEVLEKPKEMNGEWRIRDFMGLSEEVNKFYRSPHFFFWDSCWLWNMYPNGHTDRKSEGWIGIYLHRVDSGPSKTLSYTVGIKNAEGKVENVAFSTKFPYFRSKVFSRGQDKFLKKFDLQSRKPYLAPSDCLTISFTLHSDVQHSTEVSLFRGLWNLSLNLKKMLVTPKRTDIVLKLKNGKIPAHKIILESRSTVFNGMFSANMRETQTGEVNIVEEDEDTIKVFLSYAYSGDPKGLSAENACEVYKVAHKYDVQDLRKICSDVMQECLSVDTICDVIAIADLYQEKKLMECAKDYFVKNKAEIFKTEKWNTLKTDNPAIGFEVLECVLGGND